ncbi:hypothetical protein O7635_26980 [Asanoa sp. WMMD1127]|uniref:hypothetical protein n=1 Tax=Asanoa sp. WMMD1127 TaxID=3016107 RepID=UPI00241782E1|nr:hypothetical protein [Asanoa sp. WMMD1127]MDG4825508.1 hypothetical protein [Asanoa sp. WMMD1127]
MRKSTGVVVGAAVAVLAVAVGGAVLVRDGATGRRPDRTDAADAWRVVERAFPVDDEWMGGPQVLLADPKRCFTGFGRDGLSTAYWVGTGDCATAEVVTPPKRPQGDYLPGDDRNGILSAVPARGGGYLAIAKHTFANDAYAYNTSILRGDGTPEGWRTVARFDAADGEDPQASHVGPIALTTTRDGYVAVGRDNDRPLAWLSADGVSWRAVDLPADGAVGVGVNAVAAAPDGRLVAIGTSARPNEHYAIRTWVSANGGRTWQTGTIPDLGGDPQLPLLLHDGRRFVALGGADGDLRGAALVLTSPDGQHWQRDEAAANARMITAATVLPGGELLAVSSTGEEQETEESGGTRECAAAWHSSPDGWIREELGCLGVPTSLTVLKDGRVAAVHWTTLFLRAAKTP